MPYIEKNRRSDFECCGDCEKVDPTTDGELNYCITKLCHDFLEKRGISYHHLNQIVGALECAKQEFLRVVVAPYENLKRVVNGPISNFDDDSRERMR